MLGGGRPLARSKEMVDGTEYEVIEVVAEAPLDRTVRYFISPKDKLIHRVAVLTKRESGGVATTWASLKNLRTDEPVDESVFQWTPPPTAKPLQLPEGVALPIGGGLSQ